MVRPNPDGWVGGSEDFDCLWTLYGHRADSPALHFDPDSDPEHERNVGRHSDYPDWIGGGA